jgi:hypothetical protein
VNCLECKRPLRGAGILLGDAPGTIVHYSRGLCWRDYSRLEQAGTLDALYPPKMHSGPRSTTVPRDRTEPCAGCGRQMRPYGSKLDDFPGSVVRKGTTCSSCCTARAKGRVAVPDVTVRKMRDDLKKWFASCGRDWQLSGIPA